MSEYGGGARPYRMRTPRAVAAEPSGDTVASALAAQILLCVILVLCMLIAKKLFHDDYLEIKYHYGVMVSDTTQTAQLMERFNDGGKLSGLLAWLDTFANGKTPLDTASSVAEAEAEPEITYEFEPEIEYEPDYITEDADAEVFPQMDFDYLKETSSLYYVSSAGGMNPVADIDTGEMLSPPKGSTLSPVYLSAGMKPPVTGLITSGFAYRYHPLTGVSDFHTGLDIAAAEDTPILAALPGEVTEVGYSQIYGNYIVLRHATNLATSYSHCNEILAREGMTVRQGERIALVGETGTATGPHLHFSVIVDDKFTDPTWVLRDYIQLVEE